MAPGATVSPLRAPVPHHPDQLGMFASAIDTSFAAGPDSPMAISITIKLHRTARQKCAACGQRRICFYVGLGDLIACPSLCAKCSGIR